MNKPITIELDDIILMGINDAKVALKHVMENECASCCMDSDKDRKRLLKSFEKHLRKVFDL